MQRLAHAAVTQDPTAMFIVPMEWRYSQCHGRVPLCRTPLSLYYVGFSIGIQVQDLSACLRSIGMS